MVKYTNKIFYIKSNQLIRTLFENLDKPYLDQLN